MAEKFKLFDYHAVNLDAGIGADHGAGCASDTGFLVGGIGKMITSIVDLLGLQGKHIAGTGDNTQVTTLATFFLDRHCSMNFRHNLSVSVRDKVGFTGDIPP